MFIPEVLEPLGHLLLWRFSSEFQIKAWTKNQEALFNQHWPPDLQLGEIGGGGWLFKPATQLLREPDDFTRWEAEAEEKLIVRAEAGWGRRWARTPTDSSSGERWGLRGRQCVYMYLCKSASVFLITRLGEASSPFELQTCPLPLHDHFRWPLKKLISNGGGARGREWGDHSGASREPASCFQRQQKRRSTGSDLLCTNLKKENPCRLCNRTSSQSEASSKDGQSKKGPKKYADLLRASYFPFCFTSLKALLAAHQDNLKYGDQLWFQAQLEQIPKAGQAIEELHFAMSEYFGNVYKTISQMNNRTIQGNHERGESCQQ